jgi:hypothetical protein
MTNDWDELESEGEFEESEVDFGPDSPDYDLSEEHGYSWEPARMQVIPQWLLAGLSLLLAAALVFPAIYIVWRFG